MQEGNESHGMTSDAKQVKQRSGAKGLAGLRDIDELDRDSGEDNYDDGFEEKEDYEF